MTDPTAIGVLATPAVAFLVGVIVVRITYYGKRSLEVHEKTGQWLEDLQKQVESELNREGRTVDDVINAASKFSSVKSIQERCERLHRQNAQQISGGIIAAIAILVAVLANVLSVDIFTLSLIDAVAASAWVLVIFNFIQSHNEISQLERRTHFRRLPQ